MTRLQASEGFRRAATALPLTRWVARRRARALFDLCAGFVYSQVLLAVVQLDLPERLRGGPLGATELAGACGVPPEAMARLLDAAVALRLLARRGVLYGLGPLGAALAGNEGVAAMVRHHALLYADLRDPVALLRGEAGRTALSGFWPYAAGGAPGEAAAAQYSALMAASQPMVAAEVLAAVPPRRHRRLLDVGGGTGAFLEAAGAAAPGLELVLFDLPGVAALARARLAGTAVAGRVRVEEGDARTGPLPRADLVTFVRVLHDHDDAAVLAMLRAARLALEPGGRLVVAEPMAETPGARAMGGAYFGLYLLAMGRGRPRTAAARGGVIERAGFAGWRVRRTRMPLLARVVVAWG